MRKAAVVASSYPPIYGAIDSFRRLIITPILVLSAIPGLDRAIMAAREMENIWFKPLFSPLLTCKVESEFSVKFAIAQSF